MAEEQKPEKKEGKFQEKLEVKPVEESKPVETPKAGVTPKVEETQKPEEKKPKEISAPTPEPKKEEPSSVKATEDKPKPAPTGKFKDIIKQIEQLSVVDLAELVKALEERFGVSAAAPVAAGPTAGGTGAPAGGEEAEEKTEFTVVLKASGDQKINVIKAIREINPDLGLKEAKDIADQAPKEVKKEVTKKEAEEAKTKLEAAGAQVELK